MKQQAFILLLLTLVLSACGPDSKHFKLEGRFLHLNQGEFYVYSTDGGIAGIDTIKVQGGRFAYEIPCDQPTTLVLVFPNFSQQPVFAAPGVGLDIKGDASHLKALKVTGSKDNELMNSFRDRIANASQSEIKTAARQFIGDHPASPVSTYLLRTYFIDCAYPDYKAANTLLQTLCKAQPKNNELALLASQVNTLSATSAGATLPQFSATDINGNGISSATLQSAPAAVIFTWATWDFSSTDMMRQLSSASAQKQGLRLVGINLDADRYTCKSVLQPDVQQGINIMHDGEMLQGSLVKKLALGYSGDNIVLINGKIAGRDLSLSQIKQMLGIQ